jgi:hypothetical protein
MRYSNKSTIGFVVIAALIAIGVNQAVGLACETVVLDS